MKIELLQECIIVLELLIKKYRSAEIDFDIFKNHTIFKIEFIKLTLSEASSDEILQANKTLQKCSDILMKQLVHAV